MPRQISIAIPSYQRDELLFESFAQVYEDKRISEIIITDDSSDLHLFNRVKEKCDKLPKVKLIRNLFNLDCYKNKHRALSFINSEFGILLDSDNVIGKDYIDKVFQHEWRPDVILTPEWARPHFDFRAYAGSMITKDNVSNFIDKPHFETMLNACNLFVNRDMYLKVFDDKVDPVTSDSIYQCYNWLKGGNAIYITPGLQYFHRVHEGHYQQNLHRTAPGFHESVLQKLRELQ